MVHGGGAYGQETTGMKYNMKEMIRAMKSNLQFLRAKLSYVPSFRSAVIFHGKGGLTFMIFAEAAVVMGGH